MSEKSNFSAHNSNANNHDSRIAKKNSKITNYHRLRWMFYFFAFIFAIILPWVKINGNHFILLSFDHQKLNLLFTSFNTNELYLLPFCLIFMFAFIFFITSLLGRVWCAWACPQTIFRTIYRDLLQTRIFKIFSGRKNKQQAPRNKPFAKLLAFICFIPVAIVAASNFMWYFVPPEDFFAYFANPSEHKILVSMVFIIAAFLIFDITFIKENFCAYICPYARIQSVMLDNDSKIVIYDESRGGLVYKGSEKITKKPLGGDCIGCEACVKVCPTHIDIRRGLQLDCINCLECADACSAVQARFNRASLINWTSTSANIKKEKIKYLRPKTIGYVALLCVILVLIGIKAQDKSTLLLNINRTSELYKIDADMVKNSYIMLFQNTDNIEHKIDIQISDSRISKIKPEKSFVLKPGQKLKQVVILKSTCNAEENSHIKITAIATDNPQISAHEETIFMRPKANLCKKEK